MTRPSKIQAFPAGQNALSQGCAPLTTSLFPLWISPLSSHHILSHAWLSCWVVQRLQCGCWACAAGTCSASLGSHRWCSLLQPPLPRVLRHPVRSHEVPIMSFMLQTKRQSFWLVTSRRYVGQHISMWKWAGGRVCWAWLEISGEIAL